MQSAERRRLEKLQRGPVLTARSIEQTQTGNKKAISRKVQVLLGVDSKVVEL